MIFFETGRLIVRRARETDLEPLLISWGDPEMTRYTDEKPDIHSFLTQLIADMQVQLPGETEPGGPWYQYMLEAKADGALIGDIGVGFGVPGVRQVELGYRILPAYHRQGYARQALAGMIGHLIAKHDMHRFIGVAAAANIASTAVLHSLGFRLEGKFRESFWCGGEWIDDEYYALLAREWRA